MKAKDGVSYRHSCVVRLVYDRRERKVHAMVLKAGSFFGYRNVVLF